MENKVKDSLQVAHEIDDGEKDVVHWNVPQAVGQ